MNILEKINEPLKVLGLMSGTSLDGVDMVICSFSEDENGKWSFKTEASETVEYSSDWKKRLVDLQYASAEQLAFTHHDLGKFYGGLINRFVKDKKVKPSLISSHGHTVFHQPEKNFTLQIGSGAQISAVTSTDTVCDFRSQDVALGGQGAPLVPTGDKLLFADYAACINLGGISNISFEKNEERIAFDICPVNMLLNNLSARMSKSYDEDGRIAASGMVIESLLQKLNEIKYYSEDAPKSIGKEWYDKEISTLINQSEASTPDLLRTSVEHIAFQHQLLKEITTVTDKILVTGGGTFNNFLLERISKISGRNLVKPSDEIINFKEAIVFAFLGLLFIKNSNNIFKSATGSEKNHCGGAYYRGN